MQVLTTEPKKKTEVLSTHSWVDFPMSVSPAEIRSTQDFLKLQPVPINRDFVERAKKLVKVLHNCITVKQNEVDVVKYIGKTINDPKKGTWISGQEYGLNGNTRAHIWRTYSNNQTIGNVQTLKLPKNVVVNVYEMDNIDDIITAYDSIDSEESVETSSATLSGVLRAQNMNKLDNVKLKTGKFVMALNISAPFTSKFGYQAITGDVYNQVSEMKDFIKQFDVLKVVGKSALSTQLSMGVAFLSGKYAGVNDGRYVDALIRLSKINLRKDVDKVVNLQPKDGIDWIIKATTVNPYGGKLLSRALPFMSGMFNDRQGALNYLSACWQSYLDGEKMETPPTEQQFKNAYVELVQETYKSDES